MVALKWGKFKSFQFNQEIKQKSSSNSFSLAVLDVLLDFVMPIVQRDDLFAKVDFELMRAISGELGQEGITFFGPLKIVNELQSKISLQPNPPGRFASSSKFFFYLLEAINKFYVPIIKHAENLSMQLERLEKELEKLAPTDFKRKMMENFIEKAKSEFFMYRIAIEDDERANLLNQFYSKFFGHLLSAFNNQIVLPNYYFLDYVEVQTFTANIKKGYFARFGAANFDLYLSVLEELLSDAYKQPNPFVQAKFFDLLFTFNIMEKGRVVGILRDHLGNQTRICTFLRAMIDFYSAIEFMSDVGGIAHTKYRYRFFITKFLLKALRMPDYQTAFLEISTGKEVSDFIGHLFTDLNFFLEEAFEKLKKVNKLQSSGNIDSLNRDFDQLQVNSSATNRGQDRRANQNTEEEQASVEAETVPALISSIKSLFKFGRSELKIIDLLSEIVPDVFSDPEWAKKISQTINYYASKMCSKTYKSYKFQNISEVGLKPLEFIKQLVLIYVRLGTSDIIKHGIINDDRSYSTEALFDLGVTAYNKKLVSPDILERYENFIKELEVMKIEKDNMEAIIGEAPEEFCCGLTYELMKDPVQLPASKLVVERNAAKQHLTLNGPYDPFTKTPLTLEDLISLPELKAKINSWLDEKRALYRQKYQKQVTATTFKDINQTDNEIYQQDRKDTEQQDDFLGSFRKV